jgi:hypothetical protein
MSAMDVAAALYESGTFWTEAGVVGGLVVAAAGVWATLTVGFPRRRLYYRMQAVAPLMIAPQGMRSELELRHHGKLLADPCALTIELASRGRKDIPNEAFNDHQPLRLDVGAPVVEILQITSEPAVLPTPKVAANSTSVNIGPSLIGRRHTITITVLTDGYPALTCLSPLIDVQVRPGPKEPSAWGRAAAWFLLVVVVWLFVAVRSPATATGIALPTGLVAVLAALAAWVRARKPS